MPASAPVKVLPLLSPPAGRRERKKDEPRREDPLQGPLLGHWQPRSVVVFRALQIGDMLCAVPALRALRRQLPEARISLVGLPWARDFVQRFDVYIDDFIEFPGYPGLPEREPDVLAFPDFLRRLQKQHFDLAVQLHGDGSIVNAMVRRFGAKVVAGFCPDAGEQPADGVFLPYPEHGSEIERLLSLSEFLGAPRDTLDLEFPLGEDDRLELQQSGLADGLLPRGYICLHPGARAESRRWPVAQFARLGDALQRRYGLPIVLTGSAQEYELAQAVIARMKTPALNAAAPISVGAMAVLMNAARLLVSNDTGVSHIAAGLGLPSVVIFRASDMGRWAPLDQELHRPVLDADGRAFDAVLEQACLLLDRCRFN